MLVALSGNIAVSLELLSEKEKDAVKIVINVVARVGLLALNLKRNKIEWQI